MPVKSLNCGLVQLYKVPFLLYIDKHLRQARMRFQLPILTLFILSVCIGILFGCVYFHLNTFFSKMSKWKKYFQIPHEQLYGNYLRRSDIKQTKLDKIDDSNYIVVNEGVHLMKKARILCFVMLKNEETVAKYPAMPTMVESWKAIRHTWGDRCARLLFFTNENIQEPSLEVFSVDGYDTQSWSGTRQAILKISTLGSLDDYNWYLKVEEDTFVIMENLAYYLSVFDL